MRHTQVKAVMFSTWKYEQGCLPTRVVMWRQHPEVPTSSYATHLEVAHEHGTVGTYAFIWGHYDMHLDDAKNDFDKRCQSLGVKFSHFNADSLVWAETA